MAAFLATSFICLAAFHVPYLDFLQSNRSVLSPRGDRNSGEIEIVEDLDGIEQARKSWIRKLKSQKVFPSSLDAWSKIGVIVADPHFIWLRDPVIFPNGSKGLCNRILSTNVVHGHGGAAVLPVLPDGRLGLIVQFRHATRRWELEIPRGGGKKGESNLEAAKRELKEETGFEAKEWIFLGSMAVDSAILESKVPIYFARGLTSGEKNLEDDEAIHTFYPLSLSDVNQVLTEGSFELLIRDKKKRVYVGDSFLTYALYLASLKKLI